LNEALAVVQKDAGKAFDPAVVEVLARRYVELERAAKASTMANRAKLSTDIKVARGAAPGAGFEETNSVAGDLLNIHQSLGAAEESTLLAELEQQFASGTAEEIFGVLCKHLAVAVPYDVVVIYRRQGESLVPDFLDGGAQRQFASLAIPLGMGLSGWVAENHKAILNGNPSVEPGYLDDPTQFSTLGSALAVPLEFTSGPCGVLSLYRRERDAFRASDLRMLQLIATRVGRALDAAALPR
jgi:GAF domain-containing protein